MNLFKKIKEILAPEQEPVLKKIVPKKEASTDFNLSSHFNQHGLNKINTFPEITELDTMHINVTMKNEITLNFLNCKKVDSISIHEPEYGSAKINIVLPDDCEVDFIGMADRNISITCGNIRRIWSGQKGCNLEIKKAGYIETVNVEYSGKIIANDAFKIAYVTCGNGSLIAENVKEIVSITVNPFGWVTIPKCERIIKELRCRDGEIKIKKDCKIEGENHAYGLGGIKKV